VTGTLRADAGPRRANLGRLGPSALPARELAPALGAIRALARRLPRGLPRGVLQGVPHAPEAQLGVTRRGRTTAGLAVGRADSRQGGVDPFVAPSSRLSSCAQQVRVRPPDAASDEAPAWGPKRRGRVRLAHPPRRGSRGRRRGHPRAFDGSLHGSRDGGGRPRERGLCVRPAPLDEHGGATAHGELDPADRAGAPALARDILDANRATLDVGREPAEAAPQESASGFTEVSWQVDAAHADSQRRLVYPGSSSPCFEWARDLARERAAGVRHIRSTEQSMCRGGASPASQEACAANS
jgi:hypothetical protein